MGRFIRRLMAVWLALTVVWSGSAALVWTAGAGQAPPDEPEGAVDFAALTIRPGDLEEPGWVHEGAFIEQVEGEAAGYAAYLGGGGPVEPVIEAMTAMGWRRKYVHSLALPSPASPGLPPQRIRSYVTEYATPEGAADGFAMFENEEPIETAVDTPTSRTFGDQSELTEDRGVSGIDGRRYRSLDLTFRSGNLVAGVTLIIYENAILTSPTGTLLESLAGLLEARITTGATPGLGLAVARLAPPEPAVVTFDDAYYRLDGADVPLAGETAMDATRRIDTYAAAIDVYQLWQGVEVGTDAGMLYGVTLLRFPDEQTAAAWVTDLDTVLSANPFYRDFQPIEVMQALGDQHSAFRYIAGGATSGPRAVLVAIRIGTLVARVHVVPQGRIADVPPAPVLELASIQAGCLGGDSCPDIVSIPVELLSVPAAEPPRGSPVAVTPAV
jgi:hypothetical protein